MRVLSIFVAVASCLAAAACGSSSKSNTAVDASGGDDASDDGSTTTPGMLTLSGTAKEISAGGQTALGGVMLTAYNAADDSVLGMATSAADGSFSIAVKTTAGIDGYLKATTPGTGMNAYKDSYLYPPATLTTNFSGVPVFVLKVSTYDLANRLLGNGQTAQNGWIALIVQDAAMMPVAGAKVTSTPMGQINYNVNSLPSQGAMSTATDGIAYDTNITAGTVSVKATKAGATFATHSIKVRPDVVTLTLITP
jgi:hypothetical protein